MSTVKQMFAVLVTVGVLSSLLLSASYNLTKPRIEQHKLEELQKAIFVVLPDAKTYEDMSTETLRVYKGLNEQKKLVGYAFIAEGSGFQGNIKMMVGITPDLATLFGMRVLEQVETPGLGGDIAADRKLASGKNFQEQFSGLKLAVPKIKLADSTTSASFSFISYIKNVAPQQPGEVEAITGATISSKSVVKILNQSIAKLSQRVQK
jgi:electron transport complex protein RnfG